MELIYYRVYPGKESEFERILRVVHDAQTKRKQKDDYTWYKLASGGEQPTYLLILPINKLADLQETEKPLVDILAEVRPLRAATSLLKAVQAAVRGMTSETIR
jgi:hypothetical protein